MLGASANVLLCLSFISRLQAVIIIELEQQFLTVGVKSPHAFRIKHLIHQVDKVTFYGFCWFAALTSGVKAKRLGSVIMQGTFFVRFTFILLSLFHLRVPCNCS